MASRNFRQIKGVYEEELLPNGQYRYNLVDREITNWIVSVYDDKDLLTITRNGESKTVKVENATKGGFIFSIKKTKVVASGGAKGLFGFFCNHLQTECEFDFIYLENIFNTTKAIEV